MTLLRLPGAVGAGLTLPRPRREPGRSLRATWPRPPRPRSVDRAEMLEGGFIEVGDDSVHSPAADLDPRTLEGIELRPIGRSRFGHPVAVADASEPRLERFGLLVEDEAAVLHDPDPRGDSLDAREVVRRHEHGRAAVGELADELLVEPPARDDIEAERRVIEDEKVGECPRATASITSPFCPFDSRANGVSEGTANRAKRSARPSRPTADRGGGEVRDLPRGHRRRGIRLFGTTPTRIIRSVLSFHASRPKRSARPASGFCEPSRQRRSEDLPAPFLPRRA